MDQTWPHSDEIKAQERTGICSSGWKVFLQCPECWLGMRSITLLKGASWHFCIALPRHTVQSVLLSLWLGVLCHRVMCDTDCPAQRLDQRLPSPFVLGLLFLLWFALGVIRTTKFVGSGSFL